MAQAKSMGQLTPTKLILVIDCLDVAIFQSVSRAIRFLLVQLLKCLIFFGSLVDRVVLKAMQSSSNV